MTDRSFFRRLISGIIPVLLIAATIPAAFAASATDRFPLGALGGRGTYTGGSSLLQVSETYAGGPGATAGLQVGDFIYEVNGTNLSPISSNMNDGWRGAVIELGNAMERAESTDGVLSLGVLRPGAGAVTINATLPLSTAWRPSYPSGDLRADALFEKTCADLHAKVQASSTADFGYNTGWFGMNLLASPNWNDTSGAKPYRNSINKLRDRCISYLNTRVLEPVEPTAAGYVDPGLENWDIASSCMFIGEYRRKTGDVGVDAMVQYCAVLLANRIQAYDQPDDSGVVYTNKHGLMGHGGVTGDYAHLWLTGINIINAHTTVALGILKAAGADFSALSGSSGLTIDQKFLTNWDWLKKCTRVDGGDDDGCVGYQGVESGWDAAGRTSGAAAGYQIYLNAGGTAPTAADLDKLARQKAYVVRHWQRQQHCHAYSAGSVALSQAVLPFIEDRSQRYFMENSRFLYTLARDPSGAVQYFPGRGNNGGDEYLNLNNVKYYLGGLFQAMGTGNLPSVPAPSATRAFVRMNSPLNDWPQLAARRAKVIGLVQALDLDITDHLGDTLTSGYTAAWSQVSGSTVGFSTTTSEDSTVTFPAAGNYRLRLTATVGSYTLTEDYDFEVSAAVTPPVANVLTSQPVSRTATPGGAAVFSVGTSGDGPFLYEWRLNGVAYWGASGSGQLALSNISAGMAGTYQCTVYTPTGSLVSDSATLSLTTIPTITSGGLRREIWTGLAGSAVTDLTSKLTYPQIPDITETVTSAETPQAYGDNYGQRLSGWLIAPTTGQYRFYIASDDASELWLSTTDSAENKVKIAFVTGYTSYRAYNSGGQSALITLTAGQRYYIEILHKEGGGGDHLAVAWQTPGAAVPVDGSAPIDGTYLESIVDVVNPEYAGFVSSWKMNDGSGSTAIDDVGSNDGTINGATWVAGKVLGALSFDGNDSVICGNIGALGGTTAFTVAAWVKVNSGNNQEGVIVQQRAVNGYNGQYQLKVSATGKPTFYAYGGGAEQFSFSGATSINDGLWHHVAGLRDAVGNAWIYLDGVVDGSVTGTTVCSLSSSIDIGIGADIRDSVRYFRGSIDEVRVYSRALSEGELTALMGPNPADAPAFTSDPMTGAGATQDVTYSGSLAGLATDPNAGDTLSYSKVSGPAWLVVSANGALTGTPGPGEVGANGFTVRVTDGSGNTDDAILNIFVDNVNDAPVFASDPVNKADATPDVAYTGSLSGDASDMDGDILGYEKLSGPSWLAVAGDGGLTGTPAAGDTGPNSFVVRVSDGNGASALALVTIWVGQSIEYPADNYGTLIPTNSSDEFIQAVQIGDLNNSSGNNGGYADFRTLVAQLTPGQAAAYTLTPGWTSATYNEAWTVWIDLNRDGDFADAGENVLQTAADKLTHSGSIAIPATASVGFSRMRIAMKYSSPQTSPTGSYTYGEVEDYSVRIGQLPVGNASPYFLEDPISQPDLGRGSAISGSLSADAADWESQELSFTMVSGPAWLSVATDGTLSGTPGFGDVGENHFQVRVADTLGATDTAALNITVTSTNSAPTFTVNPIEMNATEDLVFTGQLSASDVDAGDTLSYHKISGPPWLTVSSTGELGGTPLNEDVGLNNFSVSVTDTSIESDVATLNITVVNTNDAPVFTQSPINGGNVAANNAFTGSIAGAATDPDVGDALSYSKFDGPAWLGVGPDGALSGTPGLGDGGENAFTVRATDVGGLHADAVFNLSVTLTPIQSWQNDQFGADAGNPLIAGDLADPDKDGIQNLIEYALGTNPNAPSATGIMVDMEHIAAADYLRLSVEKNPAATDVTFSVESCGDLTDWSSATTLIETNTANQLIVRDTITGERRFIRLKVVR